MAQNINNKKETRVIDFDKIGIVRGGITHLDADIHEDGTSSLKGLGKNPKHLTR
jgi:hypothetical protein